MTYQTFPGPVPLDDQQHYAPLPPSVVEPSLPPQEAPQDPQETPHSPPDPRVAIPYAGFPHIIEEIYNFCDPQTQHRFRELSRDFVQTVDADWGSHFIFMRFPGPSSEFLLHQRCGLIGMKRKHPRIRTVLVLPLLQQQMWDRRARRKKPAIIDFISSPTPVQKLQLRELAPQTIRLLGARGRTLDNGWTWAKTATKCVIFCQTGRFRGDTIALSYTVGEVVINLDLACRAGSESGSILPNLMGYRRGLGRRMVYIFPPVGSIAFDDLDYLARAIATYPGKIAWPQDADDLGSYTIVNFPGIHQRMSHSSDEHWHKSNHYLRQSFMEKIDKYRSGAFECNYKNNSRHHPISMQGLLSFVSTETYKKSLPRGVWEEETVLPNM